MMKRTWYLLAGITIIVLAGLAWHYYPRLGSSMDHGEHQAKSNSGVVQDDSGKEVLYWYDPMVPRQRFDKPGKSPFMDMQLVPKYAGGSSEENAVTVPSSMRQSLAIRTAPVEMATFDEEIHAVGRIAANERLYYSVQTRVPGFVDRLLVRAEGDPVRKNQKIAEIYSPELLSAQKEYLALLGVKGLENVGALAEAARARLRLLGMTMQEIDSISRTGQATNRIGIYSPASGVVAELGVREGEQLVSGATLMQIVDLSKLWLIAEVPERDAGLIEMGAKAQVELQSRPGETISGEVSYLYPTLDETTRTLRVRVELPNPKGHLLPGMYANVTFQQNAHQAIAVPTESIIDTGRRKVVIVKEEQGFQPVAVETGRQAEGKTEVVKGLNEGDFVVSSGQFLIDSEASLSGVLDRLSQQSSATEEHGLHNPTMKTLVSGVGKVKEIDLAANEIILAHEPIPELEWPSMTMAFQVQDPKILNSVQVGDAVVFDFSIVNDGEAYVIERLKQQGPAGAES